MQELKAGNESNDMWLSRVKSPRSKTDKTLVEPFSKVVAIEYNCMKEEMLYSRWLLDSQTICRKTVVDSKIIHTSMKRDRYRVYNKK